MPRGVMRCRLIAINCFRSESPKVSPAALGTGISNASMQAFALLVKLFQIHQTSKKMRPVVAVLSFVLGATIALQGMEKDRKPSRTNGASSSPSI